MANEYISPAILITPKGNFVETGNQRAGWSACHLLWGPAGRPKETNHFKKRFLHKGVLQGQGCAKW